MLHVEAQRCIIVPHDPRDNLVYIFVPRLSSSFKTRLEAAHAGKVLGPTGGQSMMWQEVVKVAKDVKYSVKIQLDDSPSVAVQ